jgi:NADH:ubiquinone oxidoreductase subunit 3 (subunit A)
MFTSWVLGLCVFVVISLLCVLVMFISEFLLLEREEVSSYECGFEHHSLSRVPLSLRYFFLTIIFLVFDIEVIFLLFLPFNLIGIYSYSFRVFLSLGFVVLLVLSLVYEWVDGSLD